MPTYEYACSSCGEHVEVVQSFSDDPLTTCPHCGGHLRKVFGSVGIVLKGSGFYRTDSRSSSNGSRPAPKSSKDSGASPGGSAESGSSSAESGSSSAEKGGGDKSAASSSSSASAAAS